MDTQSREAPGQEANHLFQASSSGKLGNENAKLQPVNNTQKKWLKPGPNIFTYKTPNSYDYDRPIVERNSIQSKIKNRRCKTNHNYSNHSKHSCRAGYPKSDIKDKKSNALYDRIDHDRRKGNVEQRKGMFQNPNKHLNSRKEANHYHEKTEKCRSYEKEYNHGFVEVPPKDHEIHWNERKELPHALYSNYKKDMNSRNILEPYSGPFTKYKDGHTMRDQRSDHLKQLHKSNGLDHSKSNLHGPADVSYRCYEFDNDRSDAHEPDNVAKTNYEVEWATRYKQNSDVSYRNSELHCYRRANQGQTNFSDINNDFAPDKRDNQRQAVYLQPVHKISQNMENTIDPVNFPQINQCNRRENHMSTDVSQNRYEIQERQEYQERNENFSFTYPIPSIDNNMFHDNYDTNKSKNLGHCNETYTTLQPIIKCNDDFSRQSSRLLANGIDSICNVDDRSGHCSNKSQLNESSSEHSIEGERLWDRSYHNAERIENEQNKQITNDAFESQQVCNWSAYPQYSYIKSSNDTCSNQHTAYKKDTSPDMLNNSRMNFYDNQMQKVSMYDTSSASFSIPYPSLGVTQNDDDSYITSSSHDFYSQEEETGNTQLYVNKKGLESEEPSHKQKACLGVNCLDINGNIFSKTNVQYTEHFENNSNSDRMYSGHNTDIHHIPLPEGPPRNRIVLPNQTDNKINDKFDTRAECKVTEKPPYDFFDKDFLTLEMKEDPFSINKNLEHIKQQCYRSDQNTFNKSHDLHLQRPKSVQSRAIMENDKSAVCTTLVSPLSERNKYSGFDTQPNRFHMSGFTNSVKFQNHLFSHAPYPVRNSKDVQKETIDFSFLKYPPPPPPPPVMPFPVQVTKPLLTVDGVSSLPQLYQIASPSDSFPVGWSNQATSELRFDDRVSNPEPVNNSKQSVACRESEFQQKEQPENNLPHCPVTKIKDHALHQANIRTNKALETLPSTSAKPTSCNRGALMRIQRQDNSTLGDTQQQTSVLNNLGTQMKNKTSNNEAKTQQLNVSLPLPPHVLLTHSKYDTQGHLSTAEMGNTSNTGLLQTNENSCENLKKKDENNNETVLQKEKCINGNVSAKTQQSNVSLPLPPGTLATYLKYDTQDSLNPAEMGNTNIKGLQQKQENSYENLKQKDVNNNETVLQKDVDNNANASSDPKHYRIPFKNKAKEFTNFRPWTSPENNNIAKKDNDGIARKICKSQNIEFLIEKKKKGTMLKLKNLSGVAKPAFDTKSAGLSSVQHRNFINPNSLKVGFQSSESNAVALSKSTNGEEKCSKKNHFTTKMELYKLGLNTKTMLKPKGEQASVRLKKLKSSLNLGSMENLVKIAKVINTKFRALGRPKSIVNEIREAKCLGDKWSFSSHWKTNLKGEEHSTVSSKISMSSLHPKLRHKKENFSVGKPVQLNQTLINKMPKVTVLKKCNEFVNNDDCMLNVKAGSHTKSQNVALPKDKVHIRKSHRLHKSKVEKRKHKLKTENEKLAFMKELKLSKTKLTQKKVVKHINVTKRGKFTMTTPTTFTVKSSKIIKSKTADEHHLDESDDEDESDRLVKACEVARQCLLKRQLNEQQTSSDRSDAKLNNSNTVDDDHNENKLLICDETTETEAHLSDPLDVSNIVIDEQENSNLPLSETESVRDFANVDEEKVNHEEYKRQSQIIPETHSSTTHLDQVSESSLDTPNTMDVIMPKTLSPSQKGSSETEVRTAQGYSKAFLTNFSIDNLIKPEFKSKNCNAERLDAEVYHIEKPSYVVMCETTRKHSSPEVNEKAPSLFDSPGVRNKFREKGDSGWIDGASTGVATAKWKTGISPCIGEQPSVEKTVHGSENNEECTSKPFIAVPLQISGNQVEDFSLTDTVIDLSIDGMRGEDLDLNLVPETQPEESNAIIKHCSSSLEVSPGKARDEVDQNFAENSYRVLRNVSCSENPQKLSDPTIMGSAGIVNENLADVSRVNNEQYLDIEDQVLDENCKKNFFECIANAFIQDENLMKNLSSKTSHSEKDEKALNEQYQPKTSPVELDTQNFSESKLKDSAVDEIVSSFLPIIPLKRIDSLKDSSHTSHNTNDETKKFVSARTPIRVRDYRKRKYVKRFPVPLPRTKSKEKVHCQEKELYEAAKEFLGDFNDQSKRACRIKTYAKRDEPQTKAKTDQAYQETKSDVEQKARIHKPVSSSFRNTDYVIKNNRKRVCQNKENIRNCDKAKKIKDKYMIPAEHSERIIRHSNENEKQETACVSRIVNRESDMPYCKTIKTGMKRRIPVLKIKKSYIDQDLHELKTEEHSKGFIEEKIKSVVHLSVKENYRGQKTEKENNCTKKIPSVRVSCETQPSQDDLSTWCTKCSKKFTSKVEKKRHVRNDHDVKVPCTVCGISLCSRPAYKRHLSSLLHLRRSAEHRRCSPTLKAKGKRVFHQKSNAKLSSPETQNLLKSPKLGKKLTTRNQTKNQKACTEVKIKTVKLKNANGKVKQDKGKVDPDNKEKTKQDLVKDNYCAVCEQFYTSRNINRHLKTDKHLKSALAAMRKKLDPKLPSRGDRKDSTSSEVNSSIDYSEAEMFRNPDTNDVTQNTTGDSFQLPASYLEQNDGDNKLRQIALYHPTFLVKNVNTSSEIDTTAAYKDTQALDICSYLGNFKGQGYLHGERDGTVGQEQLSSSTIGGLVRESYVSLLSSEDEHLDTAYKVYENLNSASFGQTGGCSSEAICLDSDSGKSDLPGTNQNSSALRKVRTVSISSEDADFTASVLSTNPVAQVSDSSVPDRERSTDPICRIDSCYSLAFNGRQGESK